MTKINKNKLKKNGLLWPITACVVFFIIGIFVGRTWYMLSLHVAINQPSTNSTLLTFNIPQVPLPSDWTSKENLPGNSFATAYPLNAGIETQGTLDVENIIDYYTFSIKDPSQIILNVTDIPKALYWVLYDGQYKEIASTYRTGVAKGSTQLALENPGKYYIRVWADYHQLTNYPYTIRLNILPYFE